MIWNQRFKAVLVVLALVMLLFSQPVPVTEAQQEGPEGPSSASPESGALMAPFVVPGGPMFYSSSAFGFQPYPGSTVPLTYTGRTLVNTDTSYRYFEAPVVIPHGATITKFVAWVVDNNATYGTNAILARAAQDDSDVIQLVNLSTTGQSSLKQHLETTTISNPNVDLQNYMYWVEVGLPPNSSGGIVSFRIDYSFDSFAPMIRR